MITAVIQHYYPSWDPPADDGKEWIKCLCPFHGDENPSAAVSYEHDAFNCLACDWRGDIYSIIQRKEGMGFGEAKRYAEELLEGSGDRVRRSAPRKSSGGASAGAGLATRRTGRANRKVPARVRRKPFAGL